MLLHDLRKTGPEKWLIVPRLVAALPLAVFGAFHLTGMSPMMQILIRAGIPWPGLNFYIGPIVMVVAGLSMGFGYYARAGAVLGSCAMLVATYSKLVIEEWPGPMQPPLSLPLVVFAACLIVLVKGAGNWSFDRNAAK